MLWPLYNTPNTPELGSWESIASTSQSAPLHTSPWQLKLVALVHATVHPKPYKHHPASESLHAQGAAKGPFSRNCSLQVHLLTHTIIPCYYSCTWWSHFQVGTSRELILWDNWTVLSAWALSRGVAKRQRRSIPGICLTWLKTMKLVAIAISVGIPC